MVPMISNDTISTLRIEPAKWGSIVFSTMRFWGSSNKPSQVKRGETRKVAYLASLKLACLVKTGFGSCY